MAGLGTSGGNIVGVWFLTTATAPTRPTTWYVGLYDTNNNELVANGYVRQSVTFSSANNDNIFKNTANVTFGPASADWATAGKFQIWSNTTNGTAYSNMEALGSSKLCSSGDYLSFVTGDLTVYF